MTGCATLIQFGFEEKLFWVIKQSVESLFLVNKLIEWPDNTINW